jgi:hypothetical protein
VRRLVREGERLGRAKDHFGESPRWDHDGIGWGGWLLMTVVMVAFWALVSLAVVTLLGAGGSAASRVRLGQSSPRSRARDRTASAGTSPNSALRSPPPQSTPTTSSPASSPATSLPEHTSRHR